MPRRQKSLLFIGASIISCSAGPQCEQRVDMGCGQRLADARAVMWGALDRSGVVVYRSIRGLEAAPIRNHADRRRLCEGRVRPDPLSQPGDAGPPRNGQGSLFVLPERTGAS